MKNCVICNKSFIPLRRPQKCCSPDCSKKNILEYIHSDRYQIVRKKFRDSIRNKEYSKEYHKTPKMKEYRKIYQQTSSFKESMIKYKSSLKGRLNSARCKQRRRMIKKNIIEVFSVNEWLQMKEATKGVCPYCNKDVGLNNITLDHIYATNNAYKDFLKTNIKRIYTIKDIQPLCNICNAKKKDMIWTNQKVYKA